MPTLLEIQRAMRRSLVQGDSTAVSAMLAAQISPDRLDIYRNTFLLTLTRALRLCFPVVQKLVGEEFFEGAAQIFVAEHPPRSAWLDQYGSAFPDFLHAFSPAESVPYLSDVARLEWAVSGALHAPDTEPLDINRLASISSEDQRRIRLIAEPSINLLYLAYPADAIWRAVLAGDDAELAAIDLACGHVHLLIERRATGVEVERLQAEPWQFLKRLCGGEPLAAAIDPNSEFGFASALAEHFSLGRFASFELIPSQAEDQG